MAITKSNIFIYMLSTTNRADMVIVTHKEDIAKTFILRGIARFSL